jgi:hypothetical protein
MPGKATDSTHAILRDLTQCDSGDDCRRHSADAEPATPMAGDGAADERPSSRHGSLLQR